MALLNGNELKENNFTIVPDGVDVWQGELPYKCGCTFPTDAIQSRANSIKTNMALFDNEVSEIYGNILLAIPENDPINGYLIREILGSISLYKKITDHWASLVMHKMPLISSTRESEASVYKNIVRTKLNLTLIDEARSRVLEPFAVYRVGKGIHKKTVIDKIATKNCILFVNKDHLQEIEVVVVFNIYKSEKGSKLCEFIEYHLDDGHIVKRVFNYNNGKLGREIEAAREEGKSFEDFDVSNIVVAQHQAACGKVYGRDMYRDWDAAIAATMRAFQNCARVAERVREQIRVVPDNAIQKDSFTGASAFVNKGTVSYNSQIQEEQHDVAYKNPDMNQLHAAIAYLSECLKILAAIVGLNFSFFDQEKAGGSNMSEKSLKQANFPTEMTIDMMHVELTTFIQELIKVICISENGILIDEDDIIVKWRRLFNDNDDARVTSIMNRVNADKPTLSVADAIADLDEISPKEAKMKAFELLGIDYDDVDSTVPDDGADSNTEIDATVNDGGTGAEVDDVAYRKGDDLNNPNGPVADYERPFSL